MSIENDNNFTFLYEEEIAKIPTPFRLGKKFAKVLFGALAVSVILTSIAIMLVYDSREWVSVGKYGYNSINMGYLSLVISCALLTVIFAGWLAISFWLERKAFQKASQLSNQIYLNERHASEFKWDK